MTKALGAAQTDANIAEALWLLEEVPRRLEALMSGLSEARLARPPRSTDRSIQLMMAHLINTEIRDAPRLPGAAAHLPA